MLFSIAAANEGCVSMQIDIQHGVRTIQAGNLCSNSTVVQVSYASLTYSQVLLKQTWLKHPGHGCHFAMAITYI